MKAKSKVTLTVTEPNVEIITWMAEQLRNAQMNELDNALKKAQVALREGRETTIRTKPVNIEILQAATLKP